MERSNVGQRCDSRLLRAVTMKYNIDSTRSLVAVYNKTTDNDERAVLLGWLRKYGSRSDECLRLESVIEYSELAKITSRSTHDDGVLGELLENLCLCIREGMFLKTNVAIALCRTLTHVEHSSYGGAAQLVILTKNLLGSLSAQPKLTRKNFAQYEATFLALHQAFFLLHMSNRNDINEKEKQDLRRAIVAKENELELSCRYYPVRFHFKALRQAVERLEIKDIPSHLTQAMRCVVFGLCAFLHGFHCFRNLARCDIDPTAIAGAWRRSRASFVDMGVSKRPWFDSFRTLMAARQATSRAEMELEDFESAFAIALEEQQTTRDREDAKALRFGIIQELGILANEGSLDHTRKNATMKLAGLIAIQAVDERWIDDVDVLIALFDVTRELDSIAECDEETKQAFRVLYDSCKSDTAEELTMFLERKCVKDVPQAESSQLLTEECKDLCTKIGRDVGFIPPAMMNSNKEDLRRKYLQDDYATVISQRKQVQVNECLVLEGGFLVRRNIQ